MGCARSGQHPSYPYDIYPSNTEMPPASTLEPAMASFVTAARPTSRRSLAALQNSRYPLLFSAKRAAFSTSPSHALPGPGESIFRSSSTVGGPPSTYFQRSTLPANTVVKFVPQQTAWIVERMGRFNRILQPGLAILVPLIDRIAYVKSLKENAMEIPSQSAITADNVTLELDGVLYTRVFDPFKASYGVEDADYAITQLAQTTMRSEIGQLTLDHVLKERAALNTNITQAINEAAADWGIRCLRYEIRDIHAPGPVVEAMHRQVTAERSKRAEILASEAIKAEQINSASGEAEAIMLKAQATARGIDAVARSIEQGQQSAQGAVSLSVAEKYVDAFGKLAKEGTSVVVPGNVGDIGSMIATAMGVYGTVNQSQAKAQAQNLLKDGQQEAASQSDGETASAEQQSSSDEKTKKDEVTQKVLESFDRTQQRH